jgi:hypothetical protein
MIKKDIQAKGDMYALSLRHQTAEKEDQKQGKP